MSKSDPSFAFDKRKQLQLASDLKLCSQCLVHFLGPVNEDIFMLPTSDVHLENLRGLARVLYLAHNSPEFDSEPIVQKVKENYEESLLPASPLCPCCFGSLSGSTITRISELITKSLALRNGCSNSNTVPISIEVLVPPVMDVFRLTARTVITRYAEKMFAYPALDELLPRILSRKLGSTLTIVPADAAKVKITIQAQAHYQSEICHALWDDFKIKKIKRKFQHPGIIAAESSAAALVGPEVDSALIPEEISRKSVDTLLMHYKSLDRGGFDSLEESLRRYIAEIPASDNTETNVHLVSPTTSSVSPIAGTATSHRVGWKVSSSACPLYLLGRYRKLARDVPQSAWTVATSAGPGGGGGGDGDGDGGGDDDEMRLDSATGASSKAGTGSSALGLGASESNNRAGSSNGGGGGEGATTHQQYRRKGRSSVEEIINSAVKAALLAADCRMHPCGREDIDVRCLGNGRPFVMEVLDPTNIFPDAALLASIADSINAGDGMNAEKDIEVALLEMADRNVWETMQTKAEEKRKGYTCVVWASCVVTRSMLDELETLSRSGAHLDEMGEPCIELNQKTPLRVLHRRSLLDRKRHVYQIETVLLNDHFFLMNLVTSAGTYVKEFVHGDMGRTSPSICSLFQCQADIMQLDVTWLFDDFNGNTPAGQTYRSTYYNNSTTSTSTTKSSTSIQAGDTGSISSIILSWDNLKEAKIPKFALMVEREHA